MKRTRGRPRNDPSRPWSPARARKRRLVLGLPLKRVAFDVGVGITTIHRWETGAVCPTDEQIRRVARALGCAPIDLTRYTRNRKP